MHPVVTGSLQSGLQPVTHRLIGGRPFKGRIIYNIGEVRPLIFSSLDEIKKWVLAHAFILPRKEKFKETLLQNVYYDLLRTYSNDVGFYGLGIT